MNPLGAALALLAVILAGCAQQSDTQQDLAFTCPSIDIPSDGTWIYGQVQSAGSVANEASVQIQAPNGTLIDRKANFMGCFLERGDPGFWSGSATHGDDEGHFAVNVIEGDLHTFIVEVG